jgi:tRNA C32,U32 (ribose-2'-O)-methylase TrmJ
MHTSILVLHNVSKKRNFGELIRTAAAMGVAEIVVVGAQKLQSFGAQGTTSHMRFSHFRSLGDAVEYMKVTRGMSIAGVEIASGAQPVQTHPFVGSTAFMMGNEGQGLTAAQMEACDQLVYIPQHSAATASMNVNAACAVVLHHFATWAAFPEHTRDENDPTKYAVGLGGQHVPRSGVGLKQMRTLLPDGSVAPRRPAADAAEEEAGAELDDEGGPPWSDAFAEEEPAASRSAEPA